MNLPGLVFWDVDADIDEDSFASAYGKAGLAITAQQSQPA
jgi:hypothetical protein